MTDSCIAIQPKLKPYRKTTIENEIKTMPKVNQAINRPVRSVKASITFTKEAKPSIEKSFSKFIILIGEGIPEI
mgnify:CR=1 FL=1